MRKVQALSVEIFKNPLYKGCSLGGVSEKFDSLLLVGDGVEGPMTVDLDDPPENAVKLVVRNLWGHEYMHVEPLDGSYSGGKRQYMAGGAYCYTSDSRFPNSYPLGIHDRAFDKESSYGWD